MTFHRLPAVRGKKVIRVLEKVGFIVERQKGSHVVMYHPVNKIHTVVPVHGGETLHKSLLVAIINQSGLTVDQFLNLL